MSVILEYKGQKSVIYYSRRYEVTIFGPGYFFNEPQELNDEIIKLYWDETQLLEWDGDYLIEIKNRETDESIIYNSHIESEAVFVCEINNKTIIGNDIFSIIGQLDSLTWDLESVSNYFENSWNNILKHGKTPFKELKLLQGGEGVLIKNNNITHFEYKKEKNTYTKYSLKNRDTFKRDFIKTLDEILLNVLKNEEKMCFTVSGGIDSGTLAVLSKSIMPDKLYSYYSIRFDELEDEFKYTSCLEDVLKDEVIFVDVVPPTDIITCLKEIIRIVGVPYSDIEGISHMLFYRELNRLGVKKQIQGMGADLAFGGTPWEYPFLIREYCRKFHYIKGFNVYKAFCFGTGERCHLTDYFLRYVVPQAIKNKIKKRIKKGECKTNKLLKVDIPPFISERCASYEDRLNYAKTDAALRQSCTLQKGYGLTAINPFESEKISKLAALCDPYVFAYKESKYIERYSVRDILPGRIVNNKLKMGYSGYKDKIWEYSKESLISYLSDRRECVIVDVENCLKAVQNNEFSNNLFLCINILVFEDLITETNHNIRVGV